MTNTELVRVEFRGDTLEAVQKDGEVWVSIKRCCEVLGVDVEGQRKKLKKQAWATTDMMSVVAEDGKGRELAMIALKSLPQWLVTIYASKVKPELRAKLALFQKEAADVLAAHFLGRKVAPERIPLRAYVARCKLSHLVEAALPPDHWCVFVECEKLMLLCEEAFVAAELEMKAEDLIDVSVGLHWGKFRLGEPWALPAGKYIYEFPAGSLRGNLPVEAHCYRDEELPRFRKWLRATYMPKHLPAYVERKYPKGGLRKLMPHLAKVLPA